jgi:hypothetical protein
VRGKSDIDLDAGDLPPDLVFEADVTNSSLDKLPIYARLGVQEVWCYAGGGMEILLLNEAGEGYVAGARSRVLPPLIADVLARSVEGGLTSSRPARMRSVRSWARGQED